MAKNAHSTPTSTRRTLGAGLLAIVAGSGIASGFAASVADLVPADPDAELIGLCARAEEADRLMWAASDQSKRFAKDAARAVALRRESDDWFDQFVGHADRAACIPARTIEGLRAKARVAFLNNNKPDGDDLNSLILRDIGWGA